MIVGQLKQKYKPSLDLIDYRVGPKFSPTIFLFQKWASRVEEKWYGFDLEGVPFIWANIIDEFLEWVEVKCPDFKILQIKLKQGSLRAYLELNSPNTKTYDEVRDEIDKLEDWLHHKDLIY